MISELSAGIAVRDRVIHQIKRDLANVEASHTTVQGVAADSFWQLLDATMALCSEDGNALRVMRRTVSSHQQVIRPQKSLLRHGNTLCPLDPTLELAAVVDVSIPG